MKEGGLSRPLPLSFLGVGEADLSALGGEKDRNPPAPNRTVLPPGCRDRTGEFVRDCASEPDNIGAGIRLAWP